MIIEEIAFLTGLLLIPFMYLFTRKLLFKKHVIQYLFILSVFFSILAIFPSINHNYSKPNFYLFLLCPIYDLIIFYASLLSFKRINKRKPKDAPRQLIMHDDGMLKDRLFDVILFILWLILPISLLTYFYN